MTDNLSATLPAQTGTDERIREAVVLLARATHTTAAQMCEAAGIKRSTLYTRLTEDAVHRRSFQPGELEALAVLFGVDVSVLFHGVELRPARGRRAARLVPQALAQPWRGLLLPAG
jgi:hypothetical protein